MEGKRYDLIPGGLVMEGIPSNNESQEVSRGHMLIRKLISSKSDKIIQINENSYINIMMRK